MRYVMRKVVGGRCEKELERSLERFYDDLVTNHRTSGVQSVRLISVIRVHALEYQAIFEIS